VDRTVVLCGLGRVGWRVFESVRAAGLRVVVIDTTVTPDDPRLSGATVIRGDCRRPEVLEQAGVQQARHVVILTGDDLVNISTALLVRQVNPSARIVVRMFNQNLLDRFGGAVKNTVALSVSGLTAPLLALAAITGDVLGAFKLEAGPRQVSELVLSVNSELTGQRIRDVARDHGLVVLAFTPAGGEPRRLLDVPSDTRLSPGDRLVVCGSPGELRPLLERERGDLLPGVRWAGAVRRWLRTARRTLREVDLSVKIITPLVFVTLLASVLVFRYGLGADWAEGLYQTVSIAATGAELHGEDKPPWAKVFLSILKLAGAALIAGFTAILTQYLIRARLGGALETRWVPDGGHVVVCGLGNVGYRLVNELTAMGERVVVIERALDQPFVATTRRKGVPVFIGDATVGEVLRQARAEQARALIAATSSELANLEIALLARDLNPKLRVVVRLTDPQFAEAVRAAAQIRYAVSIPALAAPAFTAALFGDRVQTLIRAGGTTLVVVEFAIEADEDHLVGQSLRAVAIDYRLLPIALAGRDLAEVRTHRLAIGDRFTAVLELPDLERLVRREPVPATWAVRVESFPPVLRETVATLVRLKQHCSPDEAEAVAAQVPFTLAHQLTRGQAVELLDQLTQEGIAARLVEKP
jgi:Trk K+ transport system NAD-binding subunit